jgi:hypothetical protein
MLQHNPDNLLESDPDLGDAFVYLIFTKSLAPNSSNCIFLLSDNSDQKHFTGSFRLACWKASHN